MKDFFTFRRMVTPILVQIIFWVGVVACLILGVRDLFAAAWLNGLWTLIISPLIIRIVCEWLILFFKMHDTLEDMRNALRAQKTTGPA